MIATVKNNFVTSIATYTAAGKDARGIRQGDSLGKIFSAYGLNYSLDEDDGMTFYEYPFRSAQGYRKKQSRRVYQSAP